MTDSISHRGPDGDGHWTNANGEVGLGHRRLAILDLSRDGDQPMHYADGRYTIVFNGEIYNYIEIREKLLKKGYQFKSSCDTEVLLVLFDDKKEKCLDELDGMFSFALWDAKEKRLFCARDRFGEKPFYYAVHENSLYFASEMKALWAAGVPRETNNSMMFNYLLNGTNYNINDLTETFFKSIKKLKASHYFFVTPENVSPAPRRYWDLDYRKINRDITEKEATETFRELFTSSVARRLRSDVPVGSSLSGGLDSSLVVTVIDQLKKNDSSPQMTFSARFPGFAKDEGKFMQMVIDRTNVSPHYVFPDEQGLLKDFDTLCYHQEEPFGSASIYAQYCVMRLAKENNVTVLLDGQGADESLAGYHLYFHYYFQGLKAINRDFWKKEKTAYENIHSPAKEQRFKSIGRKALNNVLPRAVSTQARKIKKRFSAEFSPFLNKEYYREFAAQDLSLLHRGEPESLQASLYQSTLQGGLEDLLRYADKNSMAHSREVRLPFLSHEFVEFVFSLPENYKINSGTTKYIMRKSFGDLLPEGILNRQDKIGYEPPQNSWLKVPMMLEKIHEARSNLIKNQILDQNAVKNLDDSSVVWRLLMADFVL